MAKFIASKLFYGAVCLFAAVLLVVSGYAHKVVGEIDAAEKGISISGSPTVGAMNILVMGLESRTNFEGQCLSRGLLAALHAGNEQSCQDQTVGAQDTDTLILIHIFAGGKKAVGVSIPRDDLVTYPHATYDGITQGKIDQAYDFAYNQSLGQTSGSSMSSSQRFLEANQAGQAFEIATVEAVTGQHVDHFVETNLDGFYELASEFGGIEVCVAPWTAGNDANLTDQASGWNAIADGYNVKKGGDQYLHLAPAQALAYVRDRDSLPEVDLDRTHRQQAVLDYVIYELKHRGLLSDVSSLSGLLDSVSQYLITDSTFNLLDFATQMRALTGSSTNFSTLPIASETEIALNGSEQDVNNINVPFDQQYVAEQFGQTTSAASSAATSAPPSTITADVYNGSDTAGLAGSVSQALVAQGYLAGAVANSPSQSMTVEANTQVFYGAGAAGNAAAIAKDFGTTAQSLASLPADHVEVLLGTSATSVPAALAASSTQGTESTDATLIGAQTAATASAPTAAPTATAPPTTPGANDGQTGGNVTVSPNAPFGVPCVY